MNVCVSKDITVTGFMSQPTYRRLQCYETKQFFPQGTFVESSTIADSIDADSIDADSTPPEREPDHSRCLALRRIMRNYLDQQLQNSHPNSHGGVMHELTASGFKARDDEGRSRR